MPEHPLKIYEDLDPKLLHLVNDTRDLALADGALPRKMKLLIAMVLDAVHGVSDGVLALTREAIKAGATKAEIAEALRVAQYICGVGCVYTAARALQTVTIFSQRLLTVPGYAVSPNYLSSFDDQSLLKEPNQLCDLQWRPQIAHPPHRLVQAGASSLFGGAHSC